ncbi:MAG: NAD(P)/FAD-dependent oxidoreductase [Crocinitomicaceae bacterium]|nr:NAD(P)/FAD-dependent oxidoreductase [Crocinitomicaceae bacterium]
MSNPSNQIDVVVIGGGAAGFFAAIHAKLPNNSVCIVEKSNKFLSKVKVSGGGRCNVTNACKINDEFAKFYPRGERQLKRAFYQFNSQSTIDWFESKGVKLYTQSDNRIFPVSNDSQTIVECLMNECKKTGVELHTNTPILSITPTTVGFILTSSTKTMHAKKVIIAAGGHPKISSFNWLKAFDIHIEPPVPSLFTFNLPNNPICTLMGNSVKETVVKIEGTKISAKGALLITHWGLSGPAILQLSAWGARILSEKNYHFSIFVNWLGEKMENELRLELLKQKAQSSDKLIVNAAPYAISSKLWNFLLEKHELPSHLRWKELEGKNLNKLIQALLYDKYTVSGKTTFKEEFVTCGGVSLNEINFNTMESKKIKGLFFVGEIIDIDGITGGFNFQAAWTTGYIAGINAQ